MSHKRLDDLNLSTDSSSSKRLKTSAATLIDKPQQASVVFGKMCAYIALEFYNNKNDTRFELVDDEPMEISSFANSSGSWTHCSFAAKDDSSIHCFFAELQCVLPAGLVTTTCKILKEGEIQIGCDNCESVTHPIVGYVRAPHGNMNHYVLSILDEATKGSLSISKEYPLEPMSKATLQHKEVCGKIALDYYNNQNHTKFELASFDTPTINPYVGVATNLVHCSFPAVDVSMTTFFAVLQYIGPSGPTVTTCKILTDDETKLGCESCPLKSRCRPIYHPVDFLSENPANPIDDSGEALSKAHMNNEKCADLALKYYNKQNDTKYELIVDDTLAINPFVDYFGFWIHCCFRAHSPSSCTKLFYAEIQHIYPSGPAVTTCMILEGATRVGCGRCSSVIHPVSGYRGVNLYRELGGYPRLPDSPTFNPVPNFDLHAYVKELRIMGTKFANRALDHYNKTNGTKFAFANDDCSKWSRVYDNWIHISFDAIDSAVVKLFFAEIKYDKFSEPAVTICKIVEGETTVGCEHCSCRVATHPIVGYRGDFLVETEIDKKENEACSKIYCEEFLGETYVGPEVISHS